MDEAMLSGFIDELEKIGANTAFKSTSQNVMTSPAPSFKPVTPSIGKSALKPKSTNYSMVHSEEPVAAYGSAAGTASVPPPPVRT
jgi:hypothetical protein